MAVQAQYPCPAFLVRNSTVLEEFPKQLLGNINHFGIGGYNNYVGQQVLNGTVYNSEAESELTCNISGSRKRDREDCIRMQQQPREMLQHHRKLQILQHLERGQVLNKSSTPSVSTPPSEENRLQASQGTTTSSQASMQSPLLFSQHLNASLYQQSFEIDALVRLHNEKMRLELQEARKRHCSRSLVSVLEQQVLKRVNEKERDLAEAKSRNAELEEKINQLSAENQMWMNVAEKNESMARSLRYSLEQIILQNKKQGAGGQTEEGYGDSECIVQDARSCCNEGDVEEKTSRVVVEKTIRENRELKQKKSCKLCRENDISVLLLPCRHLCLCINCESKFDACPICRTQKTASLRICTPSYVASGYAQNRSPDFSVGQSQLHKCGS